MIKKLEKYGFTENTRKWFQSYLANRGSIVSFNKELSDVKYVNIGVPQGSVLGVLLYCCGENVQEVNEKLQYSLDCIKTWYNDNSLVLYLRTQCR